MPHHPYRSSFLICPPTPLICLNAGLEWGWLRCGGRKEGKEESVGRREGAKKRKKRKNVNQVWWNQFACCLTVREFLISHWALNESSDTSTLMQHATLPGAHQHSDKNNIFHSLWWNAPHTTRQTFTGFGNYHFPTTAVVSSDMLVSLYCILWPYWQS